MSIVTIDLTRHPPNMPLGMLLAPGAGGSGGGGSSSSSSAAPHTGAGETFGHYFTSHPHSSAVSSPTSSNVTLVAGWEHDGKNGGRHLGPIQRSGLVRLGDRLVRINGKDVTDWTFREVMDALKELVKTQQQSSSGHRKRLRTLGFAPSGTAEWSRGTHHQNTTGGISDSMFFGLFSFQQQNQSSGDDPLSARVVHSKTKYSFVSFIGGWRVAHGSTESSSESQRENDTLEQHQKDAQDDSDEPFRSQSENSLERQLNKEPSINYNNDVTVDMSTDDERRRSSSITQAEKDAREATTTPTTTDVSAAEKEKPYIQYEIQCHILFRDTSSFQSHAPSGITNNMNNSNIHHSWSVWKRFSELQQLDEELRYDFGWQMDTLNDGRGFVFPSAHGLESWWYGVRNGGGVVTSLLGNTADAGTKEGEEKKDQGGDVNSVIGVHRQGNGGNHEEESGGYWGSGLLGMFRTGTNGEDTADVTSKMNVTHINESTSDTNSTTISGGNSNCPFPPSFVERRRKELAIYWANLMKVEEIFEFGDIHSHKFGKAMAKFLEVDKVLLSKKNGSLGVATQEGGGMSSLASGIGNGNGIHQQHQHQHQQQYQSAFPAIHEEETDEAYGGTGYDNIRPLSFATSSASVSQTREVSAFHDDDVSILSDGTGAFGDVVSHHTPTRGSVTGSVGPLGGVVDIVPKQYSASNGNAAPTAASSNGGGGRRANPSKSSVASSPANSTKMRSGKKKLSAPRAKPAFQRQFLSP